MILVDTSVWISVFRDKTGHAARVFKERVGKQTYVLSRFNQLELLQGAKDQREWDLLYEYLSTQIYVEATETTWPGAAKIFFDLRRKGLTVCSPIDCCIAQLSLEHGALLLHQDNDFEKIARVRPLLQSRLSRR